MSLDLSVIIITLNEEQNIGPCLASLPKGAEVVVLDSGSSDRTAEIAAAAGANVHQRTFTNYSEQKNAALDLATRRWVLSIDADERLSSDLCDAIVRAIQSDADVGFHLRRRLVFGGRVLKFGKSTDWPVRLFLRGKARFQNAIHEELIFGEGNRIGWLTTGELLHYSYKDLTDYFAKFNRYTSAIATQQRARGRKHNRFLISLRPLLEFFSRYVLRLGFLDGYEGYTYALISSTYVFVKLAKQLED